MHEFREHYKATIVDVATLDDKDFPLRDVSLETMRDYDLKDSIKFCKSRNIK